VQGWCLEHFLPFDRKSAPKRQSLLRLQGVHGKKIRQQGMAELLAHFASLP